MTLGSVMKPMTRISAPHRGHTSGSNGLDLRGQSRRVRRRRHPQGQRVEVADHLDDVGPVAAQGQLHVRETEVVGVRRSRQGDEHDEEGQATHLGEGAHCVLTKRARSRQWPPFTRT